MRPESLQGLTEAIYDAAADPGVWPQVMRQMRQVFRTNAETFYFLDFETRRVRSVHLSGVSDDWYRDFAQCYFTPDNPWCIHSKRLHRPGVVRTNERLMRLTGDPQILRRSVYYNEWMRPQGFEHSLGNTLLADHGTIANVTLLRPPDLPTFQPHEVAAFERISRELERAMRLAARFEALAGMQAAGLHLLERLPEAALLLDAQGRVLHANAAARALLLHRDGLTLRSGRLIAALASEQPRLDRALRLQDDAATCTGGRDLVLRRGTGRRCFALSVTPLSGGRTQYFAAGPARLLTITPLPDARAVAADALHDLYGFTPAEARLARALADGSGLREGAARCGITHETARSYLKALFRKTGTHRQAQLVARLMRDGVATGQDRSPTTEDPRKTR